MLIEDHSLNGPFTIIIVIKINYFLLDSFQPQLSIIPFLLLLNQLFKFDYQALPNGIQYLLFTLLTVKFIILLFISLTLVVKFIINSIVFNSKFPLFHFLIAPFIAKEFVFPLEIIGFLLRYRFFLIIIGLQVL